MRKRKGPYSEEIKRALLPAILREEDVAGVLGISADEVRKMILEGRLPASRICNKFVMRREDFLEALVPEKM